ncbi:MAG TPA: hypothetical protein VNQ79_24480 [Blastocatellia bacterium]|nr:hypothetical protein [Blastocatellia bacterium]
MTGPDPLFNFIFLIVAIVISRVIMERALRQLSADEKARLLDSFSGYRTWNLAAVLLLVVLYFAGMRYLPEWRLTWDLLFLASFLTVMLAVSVFSYRKLKELNLPTGYIRSYLLSLGIQYVGVAFVFAPMVANLVS